MLDEVVLDHLLKRITVRVTTNDHALHFKLTLVSKAKNSTASPVQQAKRAFPLTMIETALYLFLYVTQAPKTVGENGTLKKGIELRATGLFQSSA